MKRLSNILLIAILGLVFFGDLVVHPTQVLYADFSDLFAEHIPAKRFLVRSWQETGQIPLWCPHSFSGMPIISDIQVGAFYPPHFLLYLLPEEWIGSALSWLIVLHVIVAGWCMYAYAGSHLRPLGALTAAIGYMFAGKWMLHLLAAGHYITIGLAWLPLVLLLMEQAIRRRSLLRATWAGAVFAMLILGTHPQWTLYAGFFVTLWTFGTVLNKENGNRKEEEHAGSPPVGEPSSILHPPFSMLLLRRWLGYGLWCMLIAAGLTAVQLLPTMEAAGQSSRSGGIDTEYILVGGLRVVLFLIGPALDPFPPMLMWEDRGGQCLIWLIAAILAPLVCRERVRYQAGVCLFLFVFAAGGAFLFQFLPGFGWFRQPARILVVATLPMAFLAGAVTEALFDAAPKIAEDIARYRKLFLKIVLCAVLLVLGYIIRLHYQGSEIRFHIYWISLLITVPAAFWLLGRPSVLTKPMLQTAWLAILLLDLWALGRPFVAVRPEAEVYAPSACVRYLVENNLTLGRILDRDAWEKSASTPLGGGAPLALTERMEPVRGYNPLDIFRYKEYLQFISDEDEPLRPLEGTLMFPIIGNFPIVNKSLLDLLGTRYLVQPSEMPLEQPGWRKVYEDAAPEGFDLTIGGRVKLPSYTVYENPQALPRAFVVPYAEPLPQRATVLEGLKNTDFRQKVLLEGFEGNEVVSWWGGAGEDGGWRIEDRGWRIEDGEELIPSSIFHPPSSLHTTTSPPAAEIRQYLPNRVVIGVDGAMPGYLVLTDVWYPGWTCTVDGQTAPVLRADFLFRGVHVPAGEHEVVFTFAPESYRRGKMISLIGLGLVAGISAWSLLRRSLLAWTEHWYFGF